METWRFVHTWMHCFGPQRLRPDDLHSIEKPVTLRGGLKWQWTGRRRAKVTCRALPWKKVDSCWGQQALPQCNTSLPKLFCTMPSRDAGQTCARTILHNSLDHGVNRNKLVRPVQGRNTYRYYLRYGTFFPSKLNLIHLSHWWLTRTKKIIIAFGFSDFYSVDTDINRNFTCYSFDH
jgi:hypothetical protein